MFKKLKKSQLQKLVVDKDIKIEELQNQLQKLKVENQQLKEKQVEEKKSEKEITDEDKKDIEFLEDQIKNGIYPHMKIIDKKQLDRILQKYI